MTEQIAPIREAIVEIERSIAKLREAVARIEAERVNSLGGLVSQRTPTEGEVSTGDSLQEDPSGLKSRIIASLSLTSGEQAVLSAISSLESFNPSFLKMVFIAAVAGFSVHESAFEHAFQALEKREKIKIRNDRVELLSSGHELVALKQDNLLTNETVVELTARHLPRRQGAILLALFEKQGVSMSRIEISQVVGLEENSKILSRDISGLSRLSLISRVAGDRYSCAELLLMH